MTIVTNNTKSRYNDNFLKTGIQPSPETSYALNIIKQL